MIIDDVSYSKINRIAEDIGGKVEHYKCWDYDSGSPTEYRKIVIVYGHEKVNDNSP